MDCDYGWDALLRPGDASDHFDVPMESLRDAPLDVEVSSYSPVNAWWLAELARLIYKSSAEDTRDGILGRVNLRERQVFERSGVRCAIVEPADGEGRFAVLVFRGTNEFRNWITNLQAVPRRWARGGLVHKGFRDALGGLWEEIEEALTSIAVPLVYTGHSLGGALATLSASLKPPRAVYTFGSPRVGNAEFVETLRDVRIYRVVNHSDIVPTLPPSRRPLGFRHAGEVRYLTRDHRVLVDPVDDTVAEDRRQRRALDEAMDRRRWLDPPEFLADHTPKNYVALLERQMAASRGPRALEE